MSLDLDELNAIITDWKVRFGEERVAKKFGNSYYSIPIGNRKELLTGLVQSLKSDHGCDQGWFRVGSNRIRIIDACCPPADTCTKESRRKWIDATGADLDVAVALAWPKTTGMVATRTAKEAPMPASDLLNHYEQNQAQNQVHTKPVEILDRSIFKSLPKPTVVVDEDFLKELGIEEDPWNRTDE